MSYTTPKRIRLLQACRNHLYGEVRKTLATDKEIRALHDLNHRIEKAFLREERKLSEVKQ